MEKVIIGMIMQINGKNYNIGGMIIRVNGKKYHNNS
jgi:hypothetical protein